MKAVADLRNLFLVTIAIVFFSTEVKAQNSSASNFERNNLVAFKMSQLYYEADIGINIIPKKKRPDFLYFGFGYGKPTRINAWRKFLPAQTIPDGLNEQQKVLFSMSSMNELYGMKLSVGWNHWFSRIFGLYIQAGWGFVADLSTENDLPDEIISKIEASSPKGTFIYNTVPTEIGITLNVWKHCHLQGGVTYMWEEIPLLTMGVGYVF